MYTTCIKVETKITPQNTITLLSGFILH